MRRSNILGPKTTVSDTCCCHLLVKVPGVFISRLVRGGLAESTGLLAVNDEILEVNGIDVAGKSLDQVKFSRRTKQ